MKYMFWIPPFIAALIGTKAYQNALSGKLPSKGYSALVLGDSHTLPNNGWFEAMVKKYGIGATHKLAANGRKTDAMLSSLKLYLASHKAPNYVIMWGGANDSYGGVAEETTIKNVQAMVDLANSKGSKFIIVKGYDPMKVSYNFDLRKMYRGATEQGLLKARDNYAKLLKAFDTKIKGATKIVPAYTGFTRKDSTDGLHLTANAYTILGEWVGSQTFNPPKP